MVRGGLAVNRVVRSHGVDRKHARHISAGHLPQRHHPQHDDRGATQAAHRFRVAAAWQAETISGRASK